MTTLYPAPDQDLVTPQGHEMPLPAVAGAPGARSPMLEIANAMVRLYKDAFGRGPTKARATMAGPDALAVVLENSLTVAERNLVKLGQGERVRSTRSLLLRSLENEFRAAVEEILDRRVVVFLSALDTSRDVSVEFFTLVPPGSGSSVSE
jgi:uncharacterized protein YbcI